MRCLRPPPRRRPGRVSAGPVDITAFLGQTHVQQQAGRGQGRGHVQGPLLQLWQGRCMGHFQCPVFATICIYTGSSPLPHTPATPPPCRCTRRSSAARRGCGRGACPCPATRTTTSLTVSPQAGVGLGHGMAAAHALAGAPKLAGQSFFSSSFMREPQLMLSRGIHAIPPAHSGTPGARRPEGEGNMRVAWAAAAHYACSWGPLEGCTALRKRALHLTLKTECAAARCPPASLRAQVYIGEESDTTIHGGSIMAFAKSWKSGPIHSWSGGKKLADMPGERKGHGRTLPNVAVSNNPPVVCRHAWSITALAQSVCIRCPSCSHIPGARPNQVVQSKLSLLMDGWEHLLDAAADQIWAAFAAHEATRDAAARMLNVRGLARAAAWRLVSSARTGRPAVCQPGCRNSLLGPHPPTPCQSALLSSQPKPFALLPPPAISSWSPAGCRRHPGWAPAAGMHTGEDQATPGQPTDKLAASCACPGLSVHPRHHSDALAP